MSDLVIAGFLLQGFCFDISLSWDVWKRGSYKQAFIGFDFSAVLSEDEVVPFMSFFSVRAQSNGLQKAKASRNAVTIGIQLFRARYFGCRYFKWLPGALKVQIVGNTHGVISPLLKQKSAWAFNSF